ncbi:hypothetical protein [Desulforhopalus sp. IMCC35007]|uniref:hypothetical protein n=1 Tax=Desulforhopalus sp. IMCC35007 TaxID=2569543 RepID=UPI0010ADD5F7|nr:hypothetical protein [Desulforhopalus sp. IMCC35007]TKB11329.1 hypothetical protein FCL48_04790 [Desulforhopalus sp. IMCC35007]
MMKKKLWLSVIGIVAIGFSANAFAMMSGSNGNNNHSPIYGSGADHMNDDNSGHYGENYGSLHNGNGHNSQVNDNNGIYRRDSQDQNRGNEYNNKKNYKQSVNPQGYHYSEDHQYHGD